MSHPHPELGPPPALAEGGLRVVALGGLGEVGRNMTVFEYAGRLLVVDCGVLFPEDFQPGVDLILPDFDYIRDRLDAVEAIVLTHGHEDHIGAVPYLLREKPDIPLVGSRLTLAMVEAKLQEHRIKPYTLEVREGQREQLGPFDCEFVAVNHSIPDALAVAIRTRRRPGAAHRRLQDGPAPAGRPADRPARLRAARRRGRRPAARRLDERRGAGLHDAGEGHRARPRPGVRPGDQARHRRVVRQPRAPRPAGARRRRPAPAQGRLRRSLDGAQHGSGPRPRLPAGAREPDRGREVARRPARRRDRARLHRLAGRADVGAVADREPRPRHPDRRGRHGDPRVLAHPRQREPGLPRHQRAEPVGRDGRAQGQRHGARLGSRLGRRAALRLQHRPAAPRDAGARRVAAPAGQRRPRGAHRRPARAHPDRRGRRRRRPRRRHGLDRRRGALRLRVRRRLQRRRRRPSRR